MFSLKRLMLACLLASSAALGIAGSHGINAHNASLTSLSSHLADGGVPIPPKL